MHSNHTNQTTEPSPEERRTASKEALCAFWQTVHETMREAFDCEPEGKGVELHIKPFWDFMMAAVWEDGVGLTLFSLNWEQISRDFSPPSYLEPEHVEWIVEVAARHGIRCEPDRKPEA